jgi:hypothetical protein
VRKKKRGFFRYIADLIFRRKKIQRLQRKRRERIVNPSKYANEEEIKLGPMRNEYAKVVEIFDCEKLSLIYLMDTPGKFDRFRCLFITDKYYGLFVDD